MTAGPICGIADLHTHTRASDGLYSPASLVQLASERGISVLAITDHDTVAGIQAANSVANSLSILCVPGIEFSTRAYRGETHILGYGIDTTSSEMLCELESLRRSRIDRGAAILERLDALGVSIDPMVVHEVDEETSPGRPHIARALKSAGYVSSVSEAFDRYLGVGKPAFVPRRTLTAERSIELIERAGGIAVLAHPLSVFELERRLDQLVEAGLRGLEAYYGEYDGPQRESLAVLAASRGLLVTGGSDFHGEGEQEGRDLGSVCIPSRHLQAFLSAIG